jgi:pimeloyl-ACP methyl ester carboxylesterase
MTAFVLVPGAWLGGWAWRDVTPRLRAAGHEVYTPTLTGLGERRHLARPEVDLDTHIQDVVNVLEYEDLRDVVLVGHSYAGIVVTGVADRAPDRVATLVYLDSGPVPNGLAFLDINPPEARQQVERQVAEHGDGWRLPLPSWEGLAATGASLEGVDDAWLRLFRARAVDQPFGTYTQPLRHVSPAREALPKRLISCSFPLDQVREMIAGGHPWFRELAGPEWQLLELPTGHWPMFSKPNELADLLCRLG